MSAAYDVTDEQIRALQTEAAEAGDHAQVMLCRLACGDYETRTQTEIQAARVKCARVISDAEAAAREERDHELL